MNVNFLDFSDQYKIIKDEVDVGIKSVFEKGNFILGQEEKDFEAQFAKYCGVNYCSGVNSGTDALYLALAALGVEVGDEVILPSFTFIATALCISYTGAKPVFVDSEDKTFNMDPNKLQEAITDKTKVILPVHMYGQPANMKEILDIAKKKTIAVVEDACQSHGAQYDGKMVGSLGDIGCFSFYPTKGLGGCGDGGAIVTNNQEYLDKIAMLRDYGRKGRYDHKVKGYNSRLDTIQAVVLAAKLKHLDQWNQMRRDNAKIYTEILEDCEGIRCPQINEDRTHVFQTYAIMVNGKRDALLQALKEKNVSVLIHYPIPLHLQEAYKDAGYKQGDFPVAERICNCTLSLPLYPHLKRDQIEYVCQSIKESL